MTKDEARAALRVARKLYERDRAKYLESEYNRERTLFLASEAGISDIEAARLLGLPRETARRLRVKHQTRLGMDTPAAVLERRPGGVTRFPKGLGFSTGVSEGYSTGANGRME